MGQICLFKLEREGSLNHDAPSQLYSSCFCTTAHKQRRLVCVVF